MPHRNAAVWLDHNQARIFHVTKDSYDATAIHSPKEHTQLHRKSGSDSGHRAAEDPHYYQEIVRALADAERILVLGPATAKLELIRHIHKHNHALEARIIGVETVDHPTNKELVIYLRKYFEAAEQAHSA